MAEMPPEVEKDFEEFWAPLFRRALVEDDVEFLDQVKRELYDYHMLMRNTTRVYEAISGLTKSNTDPMYIIQAHEEECTRSYDEGWEDCKTHFGFDGDEIQDCTLEQPHDGPCNGWPCPSVKGLPCPRGCGQTIGECLQNDCRGETG